MAFLRLLFHEADVAALLLGHLDSLLLYLTACIAKFAGVWLSWRSTPICQILLKLNSKTKTY